MTDLARPNLAGPWLRDLLVWLKTPPARRIAALALLLVAGQFVLAVYEAKWLGLPLVRETPPGFAPYQLAQALFAIGMSALLVAAMAAARARSCLLDLEACRPAELRAGQFSLALGAAATIGFLVDPAGFHAFAQEDRPLEWASALLLLGAGLALGFHAVRGRRPPLVTAMGVGLCLVLLLIGMEEISWGQRLFGFATPDQLAQVNWQAEFNLHNVQTDLSETLYYFGAGVFLLILPLVRDLVPAAVAEHRLFSLAPRRSVALVSAPVAIFNYGHWNLMPIQLTIALAFFALAAWAIASAGRGGRAEPATFGIAATAVLIGQGLFLALGSAMADLPDATEYKEFFIALGFAWYAATVVLDRRP